MLQSIVEFHLRYRTLVLFGAVLLTCYGVWVGSQLPVDVFPDLNRPYVTILAEAPGFGPEQVERLIVTPIETALSGAPGAETIRSFSGLALGTVTVNFEWGRDIYVCRQIVQERLQVAASRLPDGINPVLGPTAAATGEILRFGLVSDGSVSRLELRSLADWDIRHQLLSVKGISQIIVIGGGLKQYEVLIDLDRMVKFGVTITNVEEALERINSDRPGGFIHEKGEEILVRIVGRFKNLSDLNSLVVKEGDHGSVLLRDVATLAEGARQARGSAGVEGEDGVILTIVKQPGANTLDLTEELNKKIDKIIPSLPEGVTLKRDIYRQADFIQTAVDNVIEALWLGAILVVIVIVLFLLNIRMSLIILTAIPLSFIATAIVFQAMGIGMNIMTLGGLAVAIGELVDSAIVGAENIYRRLRENRARPPGEQSPFLGLIARSTNEVMSSIVLGTAIVLLVIIPLFGLPGIVGRLFAPIGVAYLIAIAASMVVALTVTPVLCSLLLRGKLPETGKDSFLVRVLKRGIEPVVNVSTKWPKIVLGIGALCAIWAFWTASGLGTDLLPKFNEGAAYVVVAAPSGVGLEESSNLGRAVEKVIANVPELADRVAGRRTGRAEEDEHVMGVNISEIDVAIKAVEGQPLRPREEIVADLRNELQKVPGVFTQVDQPLEHRISHIIGGVRTQVVIKIYGPELDRLSDLAGQVHGIIREIPGVVDDYVEQQTNIPQLLIEPKMNELGRYGLRLADVLDTVETCLQGKILSQVTEGGRYFNLVVRAENSLREYPSTIPDLLLDTPTKGKVPLKAVANITPAFGPNRINHENTRRRIFVTCNVADRDLTSVVEEIQDRIGEEVQFPAGYTWETGGQHEELVRSTKAMLVLSALAFVLILGLLVSQFQSLSLATIVLLNIPQALIGSVIAVLLVDINVNMGALVGFIALCGIASRNGILMLSHYVTLIRDEGEEFNSSMILRGCKERLTPVLMTALTTNLGLIPLVMAQGDPGKEILFPVAIVIFGGLITSTLLDFTITPAAATLYGRKSILRLAQARSEDGGVEELS